MTPANVRVTDVRIDFVSVPPRSQWAFVRVYADSGHCGVGEATINRHGAALQYWTLVAKQELVGLGLDEMRRRLTGWSVQFGGLARAAVSSALDQARWDLLAQASDVPVHALLGVSGPVGSVPLYANLNRGLADRSPQTLAAAAKNAVAAGMRAVKCAPFDMVLPGPLSGGQRRAFEEGLARVDAVRTAVGPDVDLLVDCHWRFDASSAVEAVQELAAFRPYWIEAPLSERQPEAWGRVRDATSSWLAGGEMFTSVRDFLGFMRDTQVDVVMPDVKYCGGITALMKTAAVAESLGVRTSPHNPSGPVACLVSAHAATAMDGFLVLEFPWGESPDRSELVGGAERVRRGGLDVVAGPGYGIHLDESRLSSTPAGASQPTLDETLLA